MFIQKNIKHPSSTFEKALITKSRYWIKFHQRRAKVLLESNSKELFETIYSVDKVDSDDDVFRRANLQKNLHIAIILITLIGATIFIYPGLKSMICGA